MTNRDIKKRGRSAALMGEQPHIGPGVQIGRRPANDRQRQVPHYQAPAVSRQGKGQWAKGLLAGAFGVAAVAAAVWLYQNWNNPANDAPWVYAWNAESAISGLGPVKQTHTTANAYMKLVAENRCDQKCFSLHVYYKVAAAGASFPIPSEEKVSRVFRKHLKGDQPVKINYYYPMQYKGDLERSEIHSHLSYSALFDVGYSRVPNLIKPEISDEARAEIEDIWEKNPNARLEFCYYHSDNPYTSTDYTVHWYENRPEGAEPDRLAPDNVLRNVGAPRVGCPLKFTGGN